MPCARVRGKCYPVRSVVRGDDMADTSMDEVRRAIEKLHNDTLVTYRIGAWFRVLQLIVLLLILWRVW